ncbi:hypothetical protein [Pseudogulbenkiania sp. MAI-1]|uniref:hypothetical protein n=1 Tax=Pseudogulbenkiania sp. MAI-1 TaxID=990370 RepID=UPI000A0261E3|nr:hypothetical protein [Pseudogulbenkiania sp. MAI-1]
MKIIWLVILCLCMESALGAGETAVLRCRHGQTGAVTYTTGSCPAGSLAVQRPERGGYVGGVDNPERGMVTVCHISRLQRFHFVFDGSCPPGSRAAAFFADSTIAEARQQFDSIQAAAERERQLKRQTPSRHRRMTASKSAPDCQQLRQIRDGVKRRLDNNKAYQDDLQRLRDAQEALAKEGCRAFGG